MIIRILDHNITQREFENKINEAGVNNITELYIFLCINITNIPHLPNLIKLICEFVNISSIPFMEKLEVLYCTDCPNLHVLPNFPKLIELNCGYAVFKSIPPFKKLKIMYCFGIDLCILPNLPELRELHSDRNFKIKFYNKKLNISNPLMRKSIQGKLYQNIYRTYELLIF